MTKQYRLVFTCTSCGEFLGAKDPLASEDQLQSIVAARTREFHRCPMKGVLGGVQFVRAEDESEMLKAKERAQQQGPFMPGPRP